MFDYPHETPLPNARTIKLERLTFAAGRAFSENMLQNVETKWLEDQLFGGMTLNLRGQIWGENAGTHEIKYPADWWQHFKQRWFSQWLLRRYPVQYAVSRVDAYFVYKHFQPSMSDKEPRLVVVPKGHTTRTNNST
jgi:hypothetical protein